jgi:16S rRNA (guanine1207-N2)-methyltransferase
VPGDAHHYFDADPEAASDPVAVDVVVPGAAMRLTTDHGVFSRGRLDTGTAVLLKADVPLPERGDLLDLGCGAGPVALTMAMRSPAAQVWAVDVNERARRLCADNASANGIENVIVTAPDDVPDTIRFAAIWTNPPIRIGKPALHALLLHWLDRLVDGGHAVLVVQKHLGADSLQRWLIAQGHDATRIASHAGYRLLRVSVTGDGSR